MQMLQEHNQELSLIQQLTKWIRHLLRSDFHMIEGQNAVAAIVWGIVLLNPYWETFDNVFAYWAMAKLPYPMGSEVVWGAIMFMLGALHLICASLSQWRIRRITMLLLASAWAFIATMLGVANISEPKPFMYAIFALSAIWSFWRISYEAR